MNKMKNIIVFILTIAFVLTVCSCGTTTKVADNTEHLDTITKSLKLTKDYEGKSFLTDGIGKATVKAYTDGDTVRFTLEQGDIIVVRFYEIDTPESTSNIDKWGKAASLFTKTQLSKAESIVLEATAPRAEHDSYGVRYLGYVWYKEAGETEYKNLNLELVENGYSENKGINTDDYPYYSYFNKAENNARAIELRLFSKLDDPLYSTDPVDMTLKEFYENTDAFYNTDTESGCKVRLYACFTSLYISSSGTYTFTATEVDQETGKTYSINVYAGYSSSTASDMKLGHMYEIIGNIGSYYGSFQISGISYDTIYTMPEYTKVSQKNYYLTFDSNVAFIRQYNQTLYSDVTVVSSSVEGNTLTIVGEAQQTTKDGYKEDKVTYTFKVNVNEGYQNTLTAGKKFSVQGYQFVADSNEIQILNYSDITIR